MSIATKLTTIRNTLKAIKQAIINKGQTPSGDITTYPNAINNITSSVTIKNQDKTITSNGSYTADSGYTGLGTVTVNVASTIVSGNFFAREVTTDGILQYPSADFSLTLPDNVVKIGNNALSNVLAGCKTLTRVDFSNLKEIGKSGLNYAFRGCNKLSSVDLSGLTNIGNSGLLSAFADSYNLTDINLASVSTIGSQGLQTAFQSCFKLKSLSFPSLTSESFGSYDNQFLEMLNNVSGCTVHFPSNIEGTIGSWTDVVNGFGGLNTVVKFDLPAT